MYVYCVCPNEKFKSKFIKIGFCKDKSTLKKRYTTCYGSSFRYYVLKVQNKIVECEIHKLLIYIGLHLENELFVCDNYYNFNFYVQLLNKCVYLENINTFENKNNYDIIYNIKKYNILNFFIYLTKNIGVKTY